MVQLEELSLLEVRRNFHRFPESGWEEFRTTALLASELDHRGFDLYLGADALDPAQRAGVPTRDECSAAQSRATSDGAPVDYVEEMDGITGLVAEKSYGSDDPVIGVRVDIDALNLQEATDGSHRPAVEGFESTYPSTMHACGHDGHAAIGLGVAREFADHGDFNGTLKLFFQPAEEGGRGGKPMSSTTHLEDIDYFLSLHLGLGNKTGTVIAAYENPLPNTKLNVEFKGESAHAGQEPHKGENALQALSTAVQNLYSIPRHGDGLTRINVGHVQSTNPQNIISDSAEMRVEVRGADPDLNRYMLEQTHRVLRHSARMYNVEIDVNIYGETTTFSADEECVERVANAARDVSGVDCIVPRRKLDASEDASFLIKQVQENGGKATYVGIGANIPSGHHTPTFDFDERSIRIAVDVITSTIRSFDQS